MKEKEEFSRLDPDSSHKIYWLAILNWLVPIALVITGLIITTQKFAPLMNYAKEGTRKAAQGYVNARGGITKLAGAAKAASDGVKELGGTDSQAREAAAKGMLATFTGSVGDKVRNAGNNFLHGGGKSSGGHGGSSSGGVQAHQRSGQNTSHNLGSGDSRTLDNFSNPNFKNATKYDEATSSLKNMTRSEYYSEKWKQGKNIGTDIAIRQMEMAEKKQQAKTEKSKLPDNLTGNERET